MAKNIIDMIIEKHEKNIKDLTMEIQGLEASYEACRRADDDEGVENLSRRLDRKRKILESEKKAIEFREYIVD